MMTYHATFTAIIPDTGVNAPHGTFSGSFTITLDQNGSNSDATTVTKIGVWNFTVGSMLIFSYPFANIAGDLIGGGLANSFNGTIIGTNDFLIEISDFTTKPTVAGFGISQVGYEYAVGGRNQDDVVLVEAVPLPSTFLIFSSGLVGLGGVIWRRRPC